MSPNSKSQPLTYAQAGVDIDTGDALIDDIAPLVKKTHRPEVMAPLGGYAGLFQLDLKKYKNPVLVSSTDGVGTKLKLAFELKTYNTVGIDLVAMSVNDLICCGGEPLFFLDYFATGKLEKNVAREVIAGMTGCLSQINCTLLGGETAEMPGLYQSGEFDLAGFAVGVVEKDKIIDGQKIKEGDVLVGLASQGVHSNGFSLVRKILEKSKADLARDPGGLGAPLGKALLTPTKIYVNEARSLIEKFDVRGIAHITGGGLVENLPRIFPAGLSARLQKKDIPILPIFHWLQKNGPVPEDEMWRVFNMGVGLVVVIAESEAQPVIAALKKMNCPAQVIGKMVKKEKGAKEVEIC